MTNVLPVENWRKNLNRAAFDFSYPRSAAWWTGAVPPSQGPIRSFTIPDLQSCTRASVQEYFDNTWMLTEVLFSALNCEEAFFRPPYHGLRHPLIFYYVHPAIFYINKLRLAGLISQPLNAYFEEIFAMGVDEMSWDDLSKNEMLWPSLPEVNAYRREVYALVSDLIQNHPGLETGHPTITQDNPLWALFMAFEHERIHLETSSVLMRELPLHLVQKPLQWPNSPSAGKDSSPTTWKTISAGEVHIGKLHSFPSFGWDNEYGSKKVNVPAFQVTQSLITNGEFAKFVESGGYEQRRFWSEEGWGWRSFRNVRHPSFWVPSAANKFSLRTCFELIEMPMNWPVIVNYHEAKAYCAWQSENDRAAYRLVTEAEHHRLRESLASNGEANLHLRYGSEGPVDQHVFGNVWQWCEDHFHSLAGFEVHPYYVDFSTPCFDGKHQMIMGGSFISTGDEATPFARFHFRPHFSQHAGFRMVRS